MAPSRQLQEAIDSNGEAIDCEYLESLSEEELWEGIAQVREHYLQNGGRLPFSLAVGLSFALELKCDRLRQLTGEELRIFVWLRNELQGDKR